MKQVIWSVAMLSMCVPSFVFAQAETPKSISGRRIRSDGLIKALPAVNSMNVRPLA